MNIIESMDSPALFSGMFDDPSWFRWRVFLKSLEGLPLDDEELAIFQYHTSRTTPPAMLSRYAQLVVGRRGGKSRILALIAVALACLRDHSAYLVPGEIPVIAIIAKDRDQAKVILSYIGGFLHVVPLLADMIAYEQAESIGLTNRVVIEVHTGNIGSPRGRTFLAVLCDEIAFWPTGDSSNPDIEVINAVRPGLSTIPYSLLLIASSPYARRGVLFSNYSRYFGRDEAPVLVWQGSTIEMNETLIDDPLIDAMAEEDPERAAAEHGAQFRTDIVAFITRDAVEDVVARGIRELPPGGGITYSAFVDPSGGSADSMTIAVAHMENNIAVLDCLREIKPPFNPDNVTAEFAALSKSYGCSRVTGDHYAGEWPRERFSAHGILYEVSKKNKSTIYTDFLPALNGKRVRLLDNARLIGQLVNLERRTARGGRDSIDKMPGSHDDVANAACGALVFTIAGNDVTIQYKSYLSQDGQPVPLPQKARKLFASIATSKDNAVVAASYWAEIFSINEFHRADASAYLQLILCDFDVVPFEIGILQKTMQRLDALRAVIESHKEATRYDIITNDFLARQALSFGLRAAGLDYITAHPSLPGTCRSFVAKHQIQVSDQAFEKGEGHPLGAALDFRNGIAEDNPLQQSALLAIAATLDTRQMLRRVI